MRQNAQNGVVSGGYESPKVIGNVSIRQTVYDFLLVFSGNYASILYRFLDTASYLSKFAKCDLPHLHLAPPLGVFPFEFPNKIGVRNLESLGYRGRCLRHPVFSRFGRTPTCDRQTDRHTHRQTNTLTHGHCIYRAEHSSRGKNDGQQDSPSCCGLNGDWKFVQLLISCMLQNSPFGDFQLTELAFLQSTNHDNRSFHGCSSQLAIENGTRERKPSTTQEFTQQQNHPPKKDKW